ncbi:universal stress protein UspA [Micromonospora echinospora]|jgi:nucleotide-binding universal stress UspA family protein|uniref:Nucleotide-binding universal stress protein, UspA family n=1 Tax=Micromonospora echinospora TaxID=1877 RepID=A0A1C4UEX9_MICEC|nr:universal stress protein [Micromonospora echinospora]OZV73538.1 universal stress protein UspA [Micromonospora echinospora]SCE70226.1 Nucleotide-binding universal stress protein, UspA family [Micromonospora echinospora]
MSDEEIVVGYDGSPDAAAALAWALEEAGRTGQPVRLAYVFEWLTVGGWIGPGIAPGAWPDAAARQQVEQLVQQAVTDAATANPGLTVHGEVFDGPPALVLQERSAEAALLVLGSRGHGGFTGLLTGSTAVSVTAHAHCPVVVVRRDTPTATGKRVVVGVDGSETSLVALGFAVERAAGRNAPLHAVRAWAPTQWRAQGFDPDEAQATERASLEESLRQWRESFPDVPVTTEVLSGNAASTLVEASRDAQLVVIGTRGRGGLRGALLGSVSQQVLQHAHCPVAVIRQR